MCKRLFILILVLGIGLWTTGCRDSETTSPDTVSPAVEDNGEPAEGENGNDADAEDAGDAEDAENGG